MDDSKIDNSNVSATPSEPVEKQPPAQPAQTKKEECTLALASVICGGLSFFFGIFTAIPAVICGHMALNELKRNPGKFDSSAKTMSVVGLVLGYVFIGITVLAILVFVVIVVAAIGAA